MAIPNVIRRLGLALCVATLAVRAAGAADQSVANADACDASKLQQIIVGRPRSGNFQDLVNVLNAKFANINVTDAGGKSTRKATFKDLFSLDPLSDDLRLLRILDAQIGASAVLNALEKIPGVWPEQDVPLKLFAVVPPTDVLYPDQCALQAINAGYAWTLAAPYVADGVKVAIVDSGMAPHDDLPRNVPGNIDRFGHGTHLAGIVDALANGKGIVGVVWNARIEGYRFTDGSGRGTLADALGQLDIALRANPNIVLLAWGTSCPSRWLKELIDDHPGVLFVAAAGNNATDLNDSPVYPAAFRSPNLITVMATTCRDAVATFSSYGAGVVDIAAPGAGVDSFHGIISTVLNNLYKDTAYGTSMAAAHVAGAAALLKAKLGTAGNPGKIRQCLMDSAALLPVLKGKCSDGGRECGRLDLYRAVNDTVASCR